MISGHALEGMQAVISETGELEGQNPDIIAFGHLQLLYRSISQPQVPTNNGTAGSKKSPCALLQQRGHPIPEAQPPPDCVVLNRYGSYPATVGIMMVAKRNAGAVSVLQKCTQTIIALVNRHCFCDEVNIGIAYALRKSGAVDQLLQKFLLFCPHLLLFRGDRPLPVATLLFDVGRDV